MRGRRRLVLIGVCGIFAGCGGSKSEAQRASDAANHWFATKVPKDSSYGKVRCLRSAASPDVFVCGATVKLAKTGVLSRIDVSLTVAWNAAGGACVATVNRG